MWRARIQGLALILGHADLSRVCQGLQAAVHLYGIDLTTECSADLQAWASLTASRRGRAIIASAAVLTLCEKDSDTPDRRKRRQWLHAVSTVPVRPKHIQLDPHESLQRTTAKSCFSRLLGRMEPSRLVSIRTSFVESCFLTAVARAPDSLKRVTMCGIRLRMPAADAAISIRVVPWLPTPASWPHDETALDAWTVLHRSQIEYMTQKGAEYRDGHDLSNDIIRSAKIHCQSLVASLWLADLADEYPALQHLECFLLLDSQPRFPAGLRSLYTHDCLPTAARWDPKVSAPGLDVIRYYRYHGEKYCPACKPGYAHWLEQDIALAQMCQRNSIRLEDARGEAIRLSDWQQEYRICRNGMTCESVAETR